MFRFQDQIDVLLQFRAMTMPVSVSVPSFVLRYLDRYALQRFDEEGEIVYIQPPLTSPMPELQVPSHFRPPANS